MIKQARQLQNQKQEEQKLEYLRNDFSDAA